MRTIFIALLLAMISLNVSAQNKVVVIPIVDEGVSATSIWLPAASAVIEFGDRDKAHMENYVGGENCVEQDEDGSQPPLQFVEVMFPIQISVPVGRSSRITGATIYYKASDTAFITGSIMHGRDFETGLRTLMGQDQDDYDSTSFDSYTFAVIRDEDVTSLKAPTSVDLGLRMTAVGSRVCLYGVSLKLG